MLILLNNEWFLHFHYKWERERERERESKINLAQLNLKLPTKFLIPRDDLVWNTKYKALQFTITSNFVSRFDNTASTSRWKIKFTSYRLQDSCKLEYMPLYFDKWSSSCCHFHPNCFRNAWGARLGFNCFKENNGTTQ